MWASAGALAALVGLLLRVVHLDMPWINGGPKVYGPQSVIGVSPLTEHWGRRFRLLLALLPVFSLVLWLALARGLFLFFGVILVPQTVALEVEREAKMQEFVKTMWYFMPKLTESLVQGVQLHTNVSQYIPNNHSHTVSDKEETLQETDGEKSSTKISKPGQYWPLIQ